MSLHRTTVELLAPAGNWDSLEAAVKAGADAVYLGGKHFNMRLHRQDMNFDDEALANAITFAHGHGVRVYVTINNLIYENELADLERFLRYLDAIKPDAILVQDFALIQLVRSLGLHLPMHASVMMNIHNEPAIELLKSYGISRIVASRELSLAELALLKERTGMELEYFVHGDMCISESGQCIHSGVLFNKSSNRGLCLKPCRWPYRLIDDETGEPLEKEERGAYKLALNDMCMYRHIPELIQAGVFSFKIEGRMRPPEFVFHIVSLYRKAIDAYLSDPSGYTINESDWQKLFDGRVRDYSTCSALGKVTAKDIGWDGKREPRFFSHAVPEADVPEVNEIASCTSTRDMRKDFRLAVRVADEECAIAAVDHGANAVYIGGDVYRPRRPWTLQIMQRVVEYAHKHNALAVVETPRTAMRRECGELEAFLAGLDAIRPDGLCIGNPGTLKLAKEHTDLPIQADVSMNLCNRKALEFLKAQGVNLAAISLELPQEALRELLQSAVMPLEIIVHGAYTAMVCDHNIPAFSLSPDAFADAHFSDRHYALLDEAGEKHPIRIDQYGRNHILFAKDICLYPYLRNLNGVSSYRIEAHDYTPEWTGALTAFYRSALDAIANGEEDLPPFSRIQSGGPRPLGVGVFRFSKAV